MIPQIIVVDDDPIILKGAWNTLTGAGFKVIALKSGKALLEHTKDNPAPNLILMDISMPEMDFPWGQWTLSESHLYPAFLCSG